jgi:hypothetical protein
MSTKLFLWIKKNKKGIKKNKKGIKKTKSKDDNPVEQ